MNSQKTNDKMQLDISNASDLLCSSCGHNLFQPVLMFKKVSAIISPTGEEMLIPIETCVCVKCGNMNDEFNPEKRMP